MKKQQTYEFTLVLDGVDSQTEGLEDRLFEAGCDDALINFRGSAVYLDFCREAGSIEEAMISAIKATESAREAIKVISVLPDDLVTEAQIAKRLNKSRQCVSHWINEMRRKGEPFPKPVGGFAEKSLMWRWFEVVQWLDQQDLIHDENMLASAKCIEHVNAVLGERDPGIKAYRHRILRRLGHDNDRRAVL